MQDFFDAPHVPVKNEGFHYFTYILHALVHFSMLLGSGAHILALRRYGTSLCFTFKTVQLLHMSSFLFNRIINNGVVPTNAVEYEIFRLMP